MVDNLFIFGRTTLFTLVDINLQQPVRLTVYGTLTTVHQECNICGNGYKWHSQPLILGKYPAGHGRQSWGMGGGGEASPQFLEWRDEYLIIPTNFLTCLMKFCFLVT